MPLQKTIADVLTERTLPTRYYTGLTSNLAAQLDTHNAGRVPGIASNCGALDSATGHS